MLRTRDIYYHTYTLHCLNQLVWSAGFAGQSKVAFEAGTKPWRALWLSSRGAWVCLPPSLSLALSDFFAASLSVALLQAATV